MLNKIEEKLNKADVTKREAKLMVIGGILESIDTQSIIDKLEEIGVSVNDQDLFFLIDYIMD